MTQHERRPILLGQREQGGIQVVAQFARRGSRRRVGGVGERAASRKLPGVAAADVPRRPNRDLIEPGADRGAARQAASPANQYQERCLECVLGIGHIGKQALASGPNQRSVAADQFGERRFVAGIQERRQQFAIGANLGDGGKCPGEGGSERDHVYIMSRPGPARALNSGRAEGLRQGTLTSTDWKSGNFTAIPVSIPVEFTFTLISDQKRGSPIAHGLPRARTTRTIMLRFWLPPNGRRTA